MSGNWFRQRLGIGRRSAADEGRKVSVRATSLSLLLLAGAVLAADPPAGDEVASRSLEHHLVKLSYASAATALNAFKLLGFTIVDPGVESAVQKNAAGMGGAPGQNFFGIPGGAGFGVPGMMSGGEVPGTEPPVLKASYASSQLPVIVRVPGPDASQSGLVGAEAAVSRGDLGISMIPSAATPLATDTVASETSQLLVLYQADRPEQLRRAQRLLEQVIDVPARQILVEGMVLEVSRDGLDQLGVQWYEQRGEQTLTLGSLAVGNGNTLNFVKDSAANLPYQFVAKIQALVRSGKAEVLSRPSVLTLDNRQATIRVGTDIPIATSKDASSAAEARVSFSFQYLPTGILLNVRPRASRDGREVSMLIDTTVSATVAGKDLEVRSAAGAVLASAPTIATRRVQTYARIANNTPLIIGGLVSRDSTSNQDKVPLLGDLPLVGKLFGAEKNMDNKREVIIVLTPTVMTDQFSATRIQPKDDDAFDSRDNDLFRDSYRLRAEDVFDSRYIRTNQRLAYYRGLVQQAVAKDPALAGLAPFRRLSSNSIPGEEVLVAGMLYDLVERFRLGDKIVLDRIQFFSKGKGGEFEVHTLAQLLGVRRVDDAAEAFGRRPGEALALSFVSQRNGAASEGALAEPRAEVAWVACADEEEWARRLWDMNQPLADGRERYSILLRGADDLRRLRHAIALRRLMSVNGGESQASIANYSVGRMIAIPEIAPNQNHLLEASTARYFFHSRHAFPAFDAEQARVFGQVEEWSKRAAAATAR